MSKRNGTSYARLRELELAALLHEPLPHAELERLLEAIADAVTAMDEVNDTTDTHAEDLAECIRDLQKRRDEEGEEHERSEKYHEERYEDLQRDHERALEDERSERHGVEDALDEMRARAEKAEEALARAVRDGHGLDHEAAERVAEARAELERERLISVALQEEIDRLASEVERLKDAGGRLLAFERKRIREEVIAEMANAAEDHLRVTRDRYREENGRLHALLRRMAEGTPESAHRAARIAVGRDVIESTGTLAEERFVPIRRRKRKGV